MNDDVGRINLRRELRDRTHECRSTERRRRAKRNDERRSAALPDLRRSALHRRVTLVAAPDITHLGAEQRIEPRVGGRLVWTGPVDNQNASHAHPRRDGSSDASMVRLHSPGRDQRIGTGGPRLRGDELHLADLVSAKRKCNRVVAFDQQAWRSSSTARSRASGSTGEGSGASESTGSESSAPNMQFSIIVGPGSSHRRVTVPLMIPSSTTCDPVGALSPRSCARHGRSSKRRRAGTRGSTRITRFAAWPAAARSCS